jgi:hypothetical protein
MEQASRKEHMKLCPKVIYRDGECVSMPASLKQLAALRPAESSTWEVQTPSVQVHCS